MSCTREILTGFNVWRGSQYFIFYFYFRLFIYTYDDYLTIPNYNIQYPNEGTRINLRNIAFREVNCAECFADEIGGEEISYNFSVFIYPLVKFLLKY